MQEIPMPPFASSIDEPMLFQVGDELPNLTRHADTIMTRLERQWIGAVAAPLCRGVGAIGTAIPPLRDRGYSAEGDSTLATSSSTWREPRNFPANRSE